jgi:hypothetical protein
MELIKHMTQIKIPKVEIQTDGKWAKRITNNIIWGKSQFNPNNEKDKELINEVKQITQHYD